ncbi:hypothetical protein [uncultured Algibacter sp.]|uniref:hypothetical protein n=1 Tax=uncultured Algibacter sp. TaxID=298659 RepID=UPI00261B5142|nr:hypothetical protein [uncultured Algibacter sp.]
MKNSIFILALILTTFVMAQNEEKLPYYQIPDYPEVYTAGNVAARMVDGLGFRYFWATEGLRSEDLSYKPSESGRTSSETIDHLYGLSNFILRSIASDESSAKDSEMTFDEKRKQTLLNFKKASDILRETDNLSELDNNKYPFWNVINGPISDALWHCGQVVMLRRTSGNPFNSKVSVFRGQLRD